MARLRGVALDAGKPVKVVDVLEPEHLKQRVGRHDAERPALVIDYREGIDSGMQRDRGCALLVPSAASSSNRITRACA